MAASSLQLLTRVAEAGQLRSAADDSVCDPDTGSVEPCGYARAPLASARRRFLLSVRSGRHFPFEGEIKVRVDHNLPLLHPSLIKQANQFLPITRVLISRPSPTCDTLALPPRDLAAQSVVCGDPGTSLEEAHPPKPINKNKSERSATISWKPQPEGSELPRVLETFRTLPTRLHAVHSLLV
jgi:hypothetical protein